LEDLVRARIAASIVLAVGIVLGTAGCNLLAPQATTRAYDASDGVSGNVGDVDVRNAILISDNGRTGNLVVTFVNNGSKSHRVGIQHGATKKSDAYVTVLPGQVKQVGSDSSHQVQLTGMDTRAGALYPVYFQYSDKPGVQLLVPVLTNAMAEYRTFTPTPTPTVKVTVPDVTATPTPTPTP
jgi:hypothetical protein